MTASAMAAAAKAASVESTPEGMAAAVRSAAETACAKATTVITSARPTKRPERATAVESCGVGSPVGLAEGPFTWGRPVRRCIDLGVVSRRGSISKGSVGPG